MYTYKRYSGLPPINRSIKRIVLKIKDRTFYIRAALYICIAAMLSVSLLFVNSAAAWAASKEQIAFQAEGQPEEVSVEEDEFQGSLIDPKLILSQEIPVIYGVDLEQVNPDEDNDFNADIYFDVLPEDIKTEIIKFSSEPKNFYVGLEGPQILIYHTHTEEAYRQINGDEYAEAGKNYTKDFKYSVAAVGEVLKNELEKHGFKVMHDITDHMRKGLSTAYSKSLITMESYAKKYPAINVYIDLHRDSGKNPKDCVTIKGEQCAKVMFVVGTSKKPGEKKKFESNYKLALAVTNELESIRKGFTRPIRIQNSSKHYNQTVSDMCLLVEVGHNANSLKQAENTAGYIALALSRVIEISGP